MKINGIGESQKTGGSRLKFRLLMEENMQNQPETFEQLAPGDFIYYVPYHEGMLDETILTFDNVPTLEEMMRRMCLVVFQEKGRLYGLFLIGGETIELTKDNWALSFSKA